MKHALVASAVALIVTVATAGHAMTCSVGASGIAFGAYDGLGLSYNSVSGSFLMTGHHQVSLNIGGIELKTGEECVH